MNVDTLFYISGAVAVLATAMVITRANAVHALLYLIVSLLAVALVFLSLGSPYVAALEVIIYAGAIMVLFVFAIMMLDLRRSELQQYTYLGRPTSWIGPGLLAAVLLGELVWALNQGGLTREATGRDAPKDVGAAMFSGYVVAVELMSLLLLAALVGAYHLARPHRGDGGGSGGQS